MSNKTDATLHGPDGAAAVKTTITLYTLPVCSQCKVTKMWLDKAGAEYRVVDLASSPADAAAVAALGYKQAPIVVVSHGNPETDVHWSGFNPDFLHKYIGSAAA